MSRCRSGGRSPTGTSSRASARQSTSRLHKQKPAAARVCPINGATQATDANLVKVCKRISSNNNVLPTDASTNEPSPGSMPTDAAGVQQFPRAFAWSSGIKQVGKRSETQSGTKGYNGRANTQKSTKGVVYLGHIPCGFNEPQMLRFFSQFGEVVGVELRRSRKTGQSKGYAYIGFEVPEVAEVVAETMNNYMMFGRILDCQVVAPSRIPPKLFRHWGKKFRRQSTRVRAAQQHNKPENALPSLRQVKRRLEKERKVAKYFKNLGLEHVAPTIVGTCLENHTEIEAGASKEVCESPDPTKNLRKTLNIFCRVINGKGNNRIKNTAKGEKGKASSAVLNSIT